MDKNNLIVVGDLHLKPKFPMYDAKRDFLLWLSDQEDLNTPKNTLLLTGDVGDLPKMPGEVNALFLYFLQEKSKFKKIIIITGNHDKRRGEGNYLNTFKHIENVYIVEELEEIDIDGLSLLALPHYLVQKKSDKVMREFYGNLAKYRPDICAKTYDVVSGHFADETQPGGIDISAVKGKRLHGDIHLPSENYIGTPVINRKDEAGKDSQIAVIGCQSKTFEFRDVPDILDFYTAPFDGALPEMPATYKMITVDGAPSELAAREYITGIPGAHLHDFTTVQEKDFIAESDLGSFHSDKAEFLHDAVADYIQEHKISKEAAKKIQNVFSLKEAV